MEQYRIIRKRTSLGRVMLMIMCFEEDEFTLEQAACELRIPTDRLEKDLKFAVESGIYEKVFSAHLKHNGLMGIKLRKKKLDFGQLRGVQLVRGAI